MTGRAQHMQTGSASLRSLKLRWRSGSSLAAAAFLLASAPQAAQAQAIGPRIDTARSFQANAVSASAPTTIAPSSDADIVTVSGPETIINWSPLDIANSDNLINILPTATSLTFVGPNSDYTVLNRILPTGTTTSGDPRGIAFGGNVTSRLGATDGPTGGNIWFYSPGGILIGSGSTFDVGGLVLTTNDIDTTGGLFGAAGEIRFSGIANSLSSVTIESGATINAPNDRSSYVAMVAPRIVQGGTVNVNGSAAYVAAEQAELTINNGLFDIAIGVGTSDANGVVHSGTTTGASSTPTVDGGGAVTDADAQAIYLVAVPKNDALTMLVGGSIGYQPAATASIINGNVVLSAGASVATTGDQTNASFAFDRTAAVSDSNIQLQNVAFGSSVSAFATNGLTATTSSVTDRVVANNTLGSQDMLLEARNQIDINATGGGSLNANGDITLRAGADGVGGTININADQVGFTGAVTSGLFAIGDLLVDVSAQGLDDFSTVRNNGGTGIGQDAVGGDINIIISGDGDLQVGGTAQFVTRAQGGKGENQNGSGQGGNINLDISSGTFNVIGTTFFDSQAIDAQNLKIDGNGDGLAGSNSVGGDISLNLSGGSVTTGTMVFELGAVASAGEASGGAQSNDATTGVFDLTVTGGTHVIDSVQVYATAEASLGSFNEAGDETSGYAGSGGANFLISGGSLTINSDLLAELNTYGVAPAALADRAALTVQNGTTLGVGGDISIRTRAFNGIDSVTSVGGSISIVADNATITTGGIFLDTSGKPNDMFFFGSAEEGKDFQAGDINLVARNSGSFTAGSSSFSASAKGNDTIAGDATGGDILIHANDGSIEFTNAIFVDANGVGGVGGDNDNPDSLGFGRGGAVTFRVQGAAGSLALTDLDVYSNGSISVGGEGGAPRFEGDGGLGFGGDVTFDLLGGTFAADNITVGSDGSGGGGGDLFTAPASPSPLAIAPLAVAPLAGGVPAGDGGDGQGGDVTFNLNGGDATVTNLTISANGFGGDGADGDLANGTSGGVGGRGIGGNTTFNAQAGTLTVTSTLTVSADGNNQNIAPYGSFGTGGYGYGTDAGSGGAGIGGTATFNLDGSATINANTIIVSTTADGGSGASSRTAFDGLGNAVQAGVAGHGGDATGGDATFNNNAGTLNFGQLTVTSTGNGGNGGDVNSSYNGQADNIAGDGGTGTGGNATININQDDLNDPVYIVDASGYGGNGGDGLNGGAGGSAYGGIAVININGTTASLDDPTIIANATGGAGGQGMVDIANSIAGDSGDGGNATGGTARLEVTGTGGNIDLGLIQIEADATGGNGGAGYGSFGSYAGDGGGGGDAAGGTVEIIARTGGLVNFTAGSFSLGSTGTGGSGGDGGYGFSVDQGDGGDGGDGAGGTGRLLAQGGTITGQDISITSTGQGGDAGLGGYYGGSNGIDGVGGLGAGGIGVIEVQEGSPGIITVGNVTVVAGGYNAGDVIGTPTGLGGRFEITDTSTDPAGLITLASLDVQALSASGSLISGFFATGNSGPIAILGDLTVNVAGNIEYDLDGDGQMTVGGNASLTSGQDILVDHSNNIIPVDSIDVSGTFAATAQGDFISTGGSRINSASTATIRAEQNATVADIAGVGLVDISALFDVNVNNAAVTGTPITSAPFVLGPQMLIRAGLDPTTSASATYDPNYDATITGAVTSTGFITINAGGSALFLSGSNTVSDNGLTVQTGDDIIIQTSANVIAGNNPATTPNTGNPFPDTNNLFLRAGNLTPLSTTSVTPIASIVAAGNIDANDFAVVMTANAIDGLGGTIAASSLSADINDAPSNAVIGAIGQSDDNGLLSAQCVEGNICLGTLNADNFVYIGQASNIDVVQGIVESGTISANDILVSIRRDIIMGTDGIATVLDATNQFLVESTEGDVDLRDTSVSSNSVLVSAVNGSLLGSASLTSVNDIGITVAADIAAASIDTDGQLTQVADVGGASETNYDVPGSIAVGSYTQGTAVRFQVTAGNNISFNQITLPDQNINLIAGDSGAGDVFLGTTTGAVAIVLTGDNVGFNSLTSSLGTTLTASSGGVSGGTVDAGTFIDMDATGDIGFVDLTAADIDLNAGGLIGGGDLTATNALNLTGGNITIGNAEAGSINFVSGLNILFDSIISPNAIALTTANGRIGGNTGDGDIDSDDDVDLTAQSIDIGDVTSGGSVTASATSGNAGLGVVLATDNIVLTATGTSTLTTAISGGNTSITGTTVTLGNGTIGGDLTLNATAGNLDASGDLTVGGGIDLDATGDIGFSDFNAQGGTFTIDAGGNIIFDSAASSGNMALNAGGGINGGDIDASGAVMIDSGGDIILDNISGSGDIGIVANSASDVTVGSVNSATNVAVLTQGAFVADEVNAAQTGAGQIDIAAGNGIAIGNVSGNDIDLTATNGFVNVTNNVDVTNLLAASGSAVSIITQQDMSVSAEASNGDISLSSAADIDVQSASATGGDISISAADDVVINGLVNAENILEITAGGLISIEASAIGNNIRTVSADMNIGSAGSLGQTDSTSDIQIFSDGTTQMVLGGGTDLGGIFALDNDEFSRIQSGGDLTIYAAETAIGGFDLTIQDLSASAFTDGNFGSDGNFNIFADQSIRVDGLLAVQGGLDSKLNLAAGNDLFVNAATGSVGLGNDSSLSGSLSLTARNIYAMTDQAFDDIQGLSTAEIDARLAQNDGTVRDNGFIVADAISVTLLASQFYVQNTGSGTGFDGRRGFVVGAGGLTVNTGPSGITPIVINGTINGVTGIPVIPATTITGAGFDQQSTINGCVINSPASCAPTPTPTPPPATPKLNDPVQDVIEEEVTPEKYVADPFATNLIIIRENEDPVDSPMIGEPVTGAGNDDLWEVEAGCEAEDNGQCVTGDETEEPEPAE